MKNIRLLALALVALTFIFTACSKDDDPAVETGTKKVQYKIIGSSDVKISTIVYYDGNDAVSKTGEFGNEWTSEAGIETRTPMVTANGVGLTDASTLKAQIIIDGKVVKESAASTGKFLQTSTSLF
ncbi:MmpS family transport accessory protein [Sphingobacterium sp. HJSM2_6]|uniref:MmpS family transport accessory protein n=1 Tax=Sphingobacterium sp. HJSM2_6 TaxID=3366264 RepID=UPI003BE19B76